MITSSDLKGVMAMMPAFATDNAGDVDSTDTISLERMEYGLNRMIGDGVDVIATTGSFGECHTLLPDEFEVLANGAAEIVNRRVPLFIGVTSLNTREVFAKMRIVEKTAADGVLVGVPFYFPSSPENAVRFYRDLAEAFPNLAIMIYHNPPVHHVRLPLSVMKQLLEIPTIVASKDNHRDPVEFIRLAELCRDRMTVFVSQAQYATYAPLGARGFWSIEVWMGPWPQLALRDAVAGGDMQSAFTITAELAPPPDTVPNMQWRENGQKISIRYAGYADPGPLRPPFSEIPPEIDAAQRKKAERWRSMSSKYRPLPAPR